MRKYLFACCAITCLMLATNLPEGYGQTIRYVKPTASGTGNGLSWANASANLQTMINNSGVGDEVWVAAGTYKPSAWPVGCVGCAVEGDKTFYIKDGVNVYGGFSGTETNLGQRNLVANISTLSGDINNNGILDQGNAYHVVLSSAPTIGGIGITLDGFTIMQGNALGYNEYILVNGDTISRSSGGGIYTRNGNNQIRNNNLSVNRAIEGGGIYTYLGNNTLNNNNISVNNASYGGGIYTYLGSNSLNNNNLSANSAGYGGGIYLAKGTNTVVSNILTQNQVAESGGGIATLEGTNRLTNNQLSENRAKNGGGIYLWEGINTLTNNSLSGNGALSFGGGIVTLSGIHTMTNNSLSGNIAPEGGGIVFSGGNSILTNNIIWGNSSGIISFSATLSVTYSIVQGGFAGTGNLNVNPLFVQQPPVAIGSTGNMRLTAGSPAIDAGTANGAPATDLDGNPRPAGTGYDIGAFEFLPVCPQGYILYVNAAATGNNSGVSWANAFISLQSALSSNCPGITEIWVATGTYKPSFYPAGCSECNTNRNFSFFIKSGLKLYGGFAGTENSLSQRNHLTNITTLSGDIDNDNILNDGNVYHVVLASAPSGDNAGIVLDGFFITGGNANGFFPIHVNGNTIYPHAGGGVSLFNGVNLLNNNIVSGNAARIGGGISLEKGITTLTNNELRGNTAINGGGGMYSENAATTLTSTKILGNSAPIGGGIFNNNGTHLLINNSFLGNTASNAGGGLAINGGTNNLINNSFSGNSADKGGGIFTLGGNNTITNNIVWGNSSGIIAENSMITVTYCTVQGGFPGTGNLNVDPLFVQQPPIGLGTTGNLRLQKCSPAINKGNNAALPVGVTTDLDGNTRIYGGSVDMGAYEVQGVKGLPVHVLFVNASATGDDTGFSWDHAFTNLQTALSFSNTCPVINEIWVAAGTYKPTAGTDRNVSFVLRNNLALYGGFAGTETLLSQRNWFVNQTILSGDIGSPGSAQDNSYTIVEASNTDATAIIDGFTISNANAFESGVINTTSRGMNGGGMYAQHGSPTISNCHFKDNNARHNGGGFYNISGSPQITNCIFSGNRAEWGGGLYNYVNASPVLRNCLFYRNRSFSNGGALLNNSSSNPVGIHCTFAGNIGVQGVAVANYNTSLLTLVSAIVWEEANALLQVTAPTPTILYSILKGGFAGEGNLDADPLFIHAATDNYQLQACSPAINAGLAWIGASTHDILGNNRPAFGGFDMGAYERQTAQPQILYVDSTATGIGDGSSWGNAFTKLEAALSAIKNCGAANTIHIAKGTYRPPPPAIAFIMDKLNAIMLGGYPSGGNGARNAAVNPVIIKGNVQVLKSLQLDGVKVEKSDMADPL